MKKKHDLIRPNANSWYAYYLFRWKHIELDIAGLEAQKKEVLRQLRRLETLAAKFKRVKK